jgi:hypothetical protein
LRLIDQGRCGHGRKDDQRKPEDDAFNDPLHLDLFYCLVAVLPFLGIPSAWLNHFSYTSRALYS